ncbi:hypothetical protein [Shewanella saliphila]|uniref:Uncharacterized protein n=1 Tax=Shewanella saliphila TaxID=2282698 RepID=A0ABQ2QD55_9GAMM|nr:hypothetical protein [Shewanella saliphila]MCL1103585.1 hypothetical protein [Shewanella saliphila]GGP71080.1 hypothetical protein GCM10009409_39230 [Shewanella saliphila]
MKMFVDVPTVYLCADVVDFRKSINGLAALVEAELELPGKRLGNHTYFLKFHGNRLSISGAGWHSHFSPLTLVCYCLEILFEVVNMHGVLPKKGSIRS